MIFVLIGFIVVILTIIGVVAYAPIDNSKDRVVMVITFTLVLMMLLIVSTATVVEHIHAKRILLHQQLPITAYYSDNTDGTRIIEYKRTEPEKSGSKVLGPVE